MGISDRLAGGLEGRAEEDSTVLMPDFFLDMIFFFHFETYFLCFRRLIYFLILR